MCRPGKATRSRKRQGRRRWMQAQELAVGVRAPSKRRRPRQAGTIAQATQVDQGRSGELERLMSRMKWLLLGRGRSPLRPQVRHRQPPCRRPTAIALTGRPWQAWRGRWRQGARGCEQLRPRATRRQPQIRRGAPLLAGDSCAERTQHPIPRFVWLAPPVFRRGIRRRGVRAPPSSAASSYGSWEKVTEGEPTAMDRLFPVMLLLYILMANLVTGCKNPVSVAVG